MPAFYLECKMGWHACLVYAKKCPGPCPLVTSFEPALLATLRAQSLNAVPCNVTQVYLLAATLRPETMYGQTNCWMLPHDKEGNDVYYGCYR